MRRQHLVHVRFGMQAMGWQSDLKLIGSYENGRRCASHRLDLVRQWSLGVMHSFPPCGWGLKDAGNGKPFTKQQCFVANACVERLMRKCSCGTATGAHQWVQGCVVSGPLKGARRAAVSGVDPEALCEAFAEIAAAAVGSVSGSGRLGWALGLARLAPHS